MGRVYICLATEHDLRLVAVSALVCLLTSFTTVKLTQRARLLPETDNTSWTISAGFVAGAGTWATHFVAMLAFKSDAPAEYDLTLTLLSILIATSGAICAFSISTGPQRCRPVIGGAFLGADIVAMHYIGMTAVSFPANVTWDAQLVATSIVLAMVFASLAIEVAFLKPRLSWTVAGTLLLAAAICSLHFTGMGALSLSEAVSSSDINQVRPSWWLAVLVVVVIVSILLTAFAGLGLDRYLARRVASEKERLRALTDATFEGILIHSDGIIADANKSLLDLLQRDRADLIGSPVAALTAPGLSFGAINVAEATELELLRSDRTTVSVEVLGREIEYQSRPAAVLAIRDITERRASEQRIYRLAFHDGLTDLPNRRSFGERLSNALARTRREGSVAVLCVDLDSFASINDMFGLVTGDSLLRKVASRLASTMRASDTLCRLGGDEFAIIQENVAQPEGAISLCRRVTEQLSTPVDVDGEGISIGASIGLAFSSDSGTASDDLFQRAQMALSRAKADGGGGWRFYDPAMDAAMQVRHSLERDLRQALALEQFRVYYQPLIDVASGRISGFEALIRWVHPQRGFVPPATFIPLAEELGLINAIGEWVLRRACTDATTWPADVSVAVNLSAVQFHNVMLADDVQHVLKQTGLTPSRLQIEVTESLLLGDEQSVLAILHKLRSLGARVVMDDFGTGYSSLSYLRRFPFDKLKIDQSFVRGLEGGDKNSAIVIAVTTLGRSLGMTVNAEGVETVEEFAALRDQGCDEVQGYLFSRPVPSEEIQSLIKKYGSSKEITHNMVSA